MIYVTNIDSGGGEKVSSGKCFNCGKTEEVSSGLLLMPCDNCDRHYCSDCHRSITWLDRKWSEEYCNNCFKR